MPIVRRSRKPRQRTGHVDLEKVLHTTDDDIDRQIAEDLDAAPAMTEDDLDHAWIVEPDGTRKRYRDVVPRKETV